MIRLDLTKYRTCWIYLLIIFVATSVQGGRVAQKAPTNYFIIGDKFSGVNYLNKILNKIEDFPLKECRAGGDPKWKHGFFSLQELQRNLDCSLDRTIVILVTKDPFAWLSSVAERKFGDGEVTAYHLLALISNRFEDTIELNEGSRKVSTTSIVKLRTRKLKANYNMVKRLKHGVVLRYEDLINDTDKVIKNAIRGRGVGVGSFNTTAALAVIDLSKREPYLNKEYLKVYPKQAIDRTIRKLDKKLESKLLGYRIPPLDDWISPKEMQHRSRNWYQRFFHTCMEVLFWIVIPTMVLILLSTLIISFKDIKQAASSFYSKVIYGDNRMQATSQKDEELFPLKESANGGVYKSNKMREHRQFEWNSSLKLEKIE